jgi:hypothetical protein
MQRTALQMPASGVDELMRFRILASGVYEQMRFSILAV